MYEDMATKANITKGKAPEIFDTDSAEIKKLKKVQLWEFDFTEVEGAPCSSLGEHADTKEKAIKLVAKRLEALDK